MNFQSFQGGAMHQHMNSRKNKKMIRAIVAAGAAAVLPSTVLAAPASLPIDFTTALGTEWNIRNPVPDGGTAFGGTNSSAGFKIDDASTADGDGDLYDDAFAIWIDDVAFSAPDPVDLTGNVITAGPVSLSGLNVSQTFEFSDTIEAVRSVVTLGNPSGSTINVTLDIANNFGSDGGTTIVDTSSGDTTFTTDDTWVVTWDNSSEINTTFITSPAPGITPDSVTDTVFNSAGNEGFGARYTVNVPAGSSVNLVFGGAIGEIDGAGSTDPSRAVANVSSAASFIGTGAVAGPVTGIPALPVWGLMFLVGITGALGAFVRRRTA